MADVEKKKFLETLAREFPQIPAEKCEKVAEYRDLVVAGNEIQNLTRLTSPEDFVHGHVADVVELQRSGFLVGAGLDIGSGCGVPGLLSAILQEGSWILTESEKKKAEFLQAAVEKLGLEKTVEVFPGRAEAYLALRRFGQKTLAGSAFEESEIPTLVARAVGPLERLILPLRKSSTWNKMILFKGPAWDEELKTARQTDKRFDRDFEVSSTHSYVVGPERKKRLLIGIQRRA